MVNQYLKPVIQTPSSLLITAITNSLKMIVTVSIGNSATAANVYIVGMLVRLFIPIKYGMWQANEKQGSICSITGNDITIDINSLNFDVFSVPLIYTSQASISFAGSRNLQYTNGTDLSVPFQSFNNIGN